MTAMLTDLSVEDFVQCLASADPAPGGGGASALAGALGASLAGMVAALTVGKPAYREAEEAIRRADEKMTEIRKEFLAAVSRDAAAFTPLAQAYALPRQAENRDQILETCLNRAAAVPMDIIRLSVRALTLAEIGASRGSLLAISDSAAAASLLRSAAEGGKINVLANTRLMKDREKAEEWDQEAQRLLALCEETNRRIQHIVQERLGLA